MEKKNYIRANYSVAIKVAKSPGEVFNNVIDLSKWWPEEYVGERIKMNTEFVFKIADSHYSKNKVIEFAPDKKVVWLTTESRRETDDFDWTGTKFIFALTPKGNNTLLKFTYDGVVFENESERLKQVCDMVIKESLYDFLTTGKVKKNGK